LAWAASVVAEWSHFVAFGVYAYGAAGAAGVGVAGVVRLLPAAAVAPVAASLGDRFRRQRFLLVVALVGALALAVSAVAAADGARVVVFAAAAVVGICVTLFRPGLQSLLPQLAATPQELIVANGATSTLESVGTLVGPLIAAALAATFDLAAVFAVGAAVLGVGVILLAGVTVEGEARHVASPALRSGVQALGGAMGARPLVGMMVAQTFVRGCLNVLIVVAAFGVLSGGQAEVGYMTAAIGVGGLVGAITTAGLRGRRLAPIFSLALLVWGLPIALVGFSSSVLLSVVVMTAVGVANSVEDVSGFTLLQRTVPSHALSGALGVFWGLAMAGTAIGSAVTPLALRLIGTRGTFLAAAAVLPLLLPITYRRVRRIDDAVISTSHLELIDSVPMFALLSLASKERIASALEEVRLIRGDVAIRQGDVGDRFYIVADGVLTAEVDGMPRDAGNFFGEIALLRDVPRTATIRAATAATLFALQRDSFLDALDGHGSATATATAVVDARFAQT
jgi:MFS family permease